MAEKHCNGEREQRKRDDIVTFSRTICWDGEKSAMKSPVSAIYGQITKNFMMINSVQMTTDSASEAIRMLATRYTARLARDSGRVYSTDGLPSSAVQNIPAHTESDNPNAIKMTGIPVLYKMATNMPLATSGNSRRRTKSALFLAVAKPKDCHKSIFE